MWFIVYIAVFFFGSAKLLIFCEKVLWNVAVFRCYASL